MIASAASHFVFISNKFGVWSWRSRRLCLFSANVASNPSQAAVDSTKRLAHLHWRAAGRLRGLLCVFDAVCSRMFVVMNPRRGPPPPVEGPLLFRVGEFGSVLRRMMSLLLTLDF